MIKMGSDKNGPLHALFWHTSQTHRLDFQGLQQEVVRGAVVAVVVVVVVVHDL